MRIIILSILTLFIALCPVFSQEKTQSNSDFPILKGPYLGQKPPGVIPQKFASGIISLEMFHDFKGSFSTDGKEYYFCRHLLPQIIPTLYFTKVENGIWTEPIQLEIAKGNPTFHPCISNDNQWLLFYWQFEKEQSRQSGYYASTRTDMGWSVPQYAGNRMCITTDNFGSFYGMEIVKNNQPEFYMSKMTFINGIFTHYERLNIKRHYGKQTHPCIAPDGKYIIFDIQNENSHLFVCFKDSKGNWGDAIDLTEHGLSPGARGAYISPDGKYLFYGYNGDIWWVNIQVVEKLRPKK